MQFYIFLVALLLWGYAPLIGENKVASVIVAASTAVDSSTALSKPFRAANNSMYAPRTYDKVRFGVKVGMGYSNTNFNKGFPKPSEPIETIWKMSYSGGFVIDVPLYKKWHFQQEYLYSHVRGEVKAEGVSYDFEYLSLPVLLKYQLTPAFSVFLGPHFDLLLYARERLDDQSIDVEHVIEERNFGAIAGMGYQITNKLSVDARFVRGVSHINIKQGAIAKESCGSQCMMFAFL
ncbi:porin family protein, partial [Pontibacter harenae]|uniref:porin family protein n=1 Tax=Pontibacter harenae TaxID=2894083 RepID=UPI001E61F658|nr:PorT family protein [Pontibacter harenae]